MTAAKTRQMTMSRGEGGGEGCSLQSFVRGGFAKNNKTRTFRRLFHKRKMNLLALLSLFTHGNDRFPYPLTYFNY